MILSDEDLRILRKFCKLKDETTTWKIMKEIYPDGSDREHMRLKRRISRMSEFFTIEGSPKTYVLDSDKVFLRGSILNIHLRFAND